MDEFLAFVTIDVWTMLFTWGNLLILLLLLKKFLFKPVNNILQKRQDEVDEMYKSATEDKNAAHQMREDYEKRLSDAKNEANEILKTATRKAVLKEEEIITDANNQASKIIERAHGQIELEKSSAFAELRDEVSELSVMIASKVLERDISESDHKEMIDKIISEMGEAK